MLVPGVELAVCRSEQFKTGLFSVTLAAGLAEDTATAYALVPEVLYRGSRHHPDMERLSAATDQLYGAVLGPAVRQRGESQCVSFLCSFLDDRYVPDGETLLEPALQLVGEVLLNPDTRQGIFREDYLRGEAVNLADEIEGRMNDKRGWSIFRMTQAMCAGEAYALDKLGSVRQALAMTREELWAGYQRLLSQSRVVFYYGGSSEPERVEAVVRQSFAPLLRPRSGRLDCQVIAAPRGPVRRVVDRLDVTQGKLAMGFRTGGITLGHRDYPALLVCNALFGGNDHSKLFQTVREAMSLCYFASSALDGLKGLLVVSSGVEFRDFDRAEQAVLEQLDAIVRGDFTWEEFQAAQSAVTSALLSQRDSQAQMEDDWVTQLLARGRWIPPEELAQRVSEVTPEQVAQVAQGVKLDTVYRLTGKEAG